MSINTVTLKTINSQIDLGPTTSIQLLFAKLQLAMAEQSKTKAMDHMDQITASQEKSKEVAEMIQKCRELQNSAKNKTGGGYVNTKTGESLTAAQYKAVEDQKYKEFLASKGQPDNPLTRSMFASSVTTELKSTYKKLDSDETAIPPNIKKFMEDNGLALDKANGSQFFDKDGWEVNITSLRNYQEQLGSDTQQRMVYIQDFMGQYNSYLQGANSAIQQSNQTLSAIARGQ